MITSEGSNWLHLMEDEKNRRVQAIFYLGERVLIALAVLILKLLHKFLVELSQAIKHWNKLGFRRKNGDPMREKAYVMR